MQLNDKDIYRAMVNGDLLFVGADPKYPFVKDKQVQPASVDLRLGNRIIRFKKDIKSFDIKDIKKIEEYLSIEYINEGDAIEVRPNEILFAQIYEQIAIPDYLSARIEGRSRVARLGISIHCTGDYINPGFAGAMPLQIINHNHFAIILYPYISICQMFLYKLTDEPLVPYMQRSNLPYNTYYNETNPSPSNLSADWEDGRPDNTTILEKKIRILVENYYNTVEQERDYAIKQKISKKKKKMEQKLQQSVINEATFINLESLGGLTMGDQYYAQQVGVQGKNAGRHAVTYQSTDKDDWNEINIDEILVELKTIKKYIKENFSDDEYDIIVGNVSSATIALESDRKKEAGNLLKKCGYVLYDIAKSIGCTVVVRYLGSVLGL